MYETIEYKTEVVTLTNIRIQSYNFIKYEHGQYSMENTKKLNFAIRIYQ